MVQRAGAFLLMLVFLCSGIGAYAQQPASEGAAAPAEKKIVVEQRQASDEEKTVSFDFPDTDIRVAIETIAIKVGVNIVAGPEVKGRISMKLDNVPWQKALDILLKTYGYGFVWDEGIIRVMSLENR